MMNDSVREELQSKVAPVSGPLKIDMPSMPKPPAASVPRPPMTSPPKPAAPVRRVQTDGLRTAKTNPTLVGFQNKNAPLPDWRLQMQNAVRQRRGEAVDPTRTAAPKPVEQHAASRTARKVAGEKAVPPPALDNADPRLSAALKRISDSRSRYSQKPSPKRSAAQPRSNVRPEPSSIQKNFPFDLVSATPNPPVRPPAPRPVAENRPKPAMVTPLRMEKRLDTNKLPLLDSITLPNADETSPTPAVVEPTLSDEQGTLQTEFSDIHRIVINAEPDTVETEDIDDQEDEIDDLAPISMRFNAGLFDLIIGAFASMILLSPVVLAGGDWFTVAGMLTFAGTWAFVLFLYMTASIGFFGRTLGMRLFSLELVDAEENEHPTIHQAAVNSSLFLLSLVCCGAGFLTVLLNEEKRAVHDLLSGTIIVREF
jgi:uncharacterized RDD family membrane protein YckC